MGEDERPRRLISRNETQAILTVDLGALVANWRLLAKRVAPARCAAVVKADAYGIGIEAAVPALAAAGCTVFFVAHPSEGHRARACLDGRPNIEIYVLNGLLPDRDYLATYFALDLRPVLGSPAELSLWAKSAPPDAPSPAIHVDTGMNRLGVSPQDALAFAAQFPPGKSPFKVGLLMSHFIASEAADDPRNVRQIELFEQIRSAFPGIAASFANSSAIFLPQRPHFDLVRPGYALYGGNPTPEANNPMLPVVKLAAPILQLREIAVGATVGYNGQWTAKRPTRLAVIGLGYADGLPRNAMATDTSPGGEAMVCGRRCRFAGRVSMDLTTIDVTDVPVEELGPNGAIELLGNEITVDDLAARSHTIGYEILTNLGRRYHRIYRHT
jgi:alanine racemase